MGMTKQLSLARPHMHEGVGLVTERDIIFLIQQKRRYETEIAIMRDCSEDLYDAAEDAPANNYAILKRRLALLEHWLDFLPPEERRIVDLHLVQNKAWPFIVTAIQKESEGRLSCDERTLQRQQAKAIERLSELMMNHFGNSLDYLIEK